MGRLDSIYCSKGDELCTARQGYAKHDPEGRIETDGRVPRRSGADHDLDLARENERFRWESRMLREEKNISKNRPGPLPAYARCKQFVLPLLWGLYTHVTHNA
jgi:hypothetical protein